MRKLFTALMAFTSLLLPVAVMSHHSFSAEFDVGRPIDIDGTIVEVEWVNPHAWLHMTVENEQGETEEWKVEMLGVNALVRSGMSPATVKPGDKLTVTGFGSRDGTNTANASSVTRTDTGESLWASAREY